MSTDFLFREFNHITRQEGMKDPKQLKIALLIIFKNTSTCSFIPMNISPIGSVFHYIALHNLPPGLTCDHEKDLNLTNLASLRLNLPNIHIQSICINVKHISHLMAYSQIYTKFKILIKFTSSFSS